MNRSSINFYTTGGTLSHDAPSYVERQADRDLLDGLRGGEFCYVLTSRQMGKSSLMVRTANKLREGGVTVIALDLTAVGQNVSAEQWYDGLLAQMGRQLRLEDPLDSFWRATERLGPCQRFFAAIQDVVLVERTEAVVIFVDEIDAVRSLPFSTDEFFAAIRECYNRRGQDPAFLRVTFCLLGVATPSDLIRDARTTPFNIGRRIELHDFAEEEAAPLARGLRHALGRERAAGSGVSAASGPANERQVKQLLKRVFYWTGGHPYLTQRFCRAVAEAPQVEGAGDVDRIGEELFFTHRARERDDNLLFVRERLLRSEEADLPSLLELYSKIWRGGRVDDEETSRQRSILRLSGIVKSVGGRLKPRNRIYSRVFDRGWVEAHMPDAELRRQRAAFRRGVIRTSTYAAAVVIVLTIAALIAVWQASKARRALARASFSQAQAGRATGLAGQRWQSLPALRQARAAHTSRDDLRDEAIACLALVDLKEETNALALSVGSHTNKIAFAPNRDLAAVALPDGGMTVHSWRDGIQVAKLPGFGWRIKSLRFSPTADLIAASYFGSTSNRFTLWSWEQARELFWTPHGAGDEAIDFSADGRKLAVGCPDGVIRVYALPGGELLAELEMQLYSGKPRMAHTLRFCPSGDWLAACSPDDQYVEIWSLEPPRRLARLFHSDEVLDLSWHPGGQTLAAACRDSRVYVWSTNDFPNLTRSATVPRLSGHEGPVRAVAFNHRGTLLATLGGDETLRLWVPATGRQVILSLPGNALRQLRFSAEDSRLIALGDSAGDTRVWQVFGEELTVLPLPTGSGDEVRAIDFSPDNRWLLTATARQITLWGASNGVKSCEIPFANGQSAWFTGDSQHMLASNDRGFFRWPVVEPAPVLSGQMGGDTTEPLFEPLDSLGVMSLTLDRARAAVVRQAEVILFGTGSPLPSPLLTNHLGASYRYLVLDPQGQWLAAAESDDPTVLHLWNVTKDQANASSINGSRYFAFSPDGHWLATCYQGIYQCYRVGSWQAPAVRITRRVTSDQHAPIAFARDGRTMALASSRYDIQLYRLPAAGSSKAELIATLKSPDPLPLEMLAFSPDGRRLAAATDRRLVELWNLSLIREGLASLELHPPWPDEPRQTLD